MSLFNSPISPLVDDYLLLGIGENAPKETGLLSPSTQSLRHHLTDKLLKEVMPRVISGDAGGDERPLLNSVQANNDTVEEEHSPPTAFLTLATITIQLSMLRQLSRTESSTDLASATCDGLLGMLQPMPIRALRTLSKWESAVLDQISGAMEDLAMTSSVLRDNVKSLLLSFAIHRASLSSVLKVLEAIIQTETMQLAPQAVDIIKRLRLLRITAPLVCDWTAIKGVSFPIRLEGFEDEHEQRFMVSSSDSAFLFMSTRKRLLKIGTGDCRVLGSPSTLAGHVYAASAMGGFVFLIDSRLYTAVRRRGSSLIEIFERNPSSLELVDQVAKMTLPFYDHAVIESEAVSTLSTLGDDKGGRTICWVGPNAWISGPNVGYYFEVVVRDDTGTLSVGWCSPEFNAADNLRLGGGGDAYCWGVDILSREKFHDGVRTAWGSAFRKGDTLGCGLEFDPAGNVTMSFSRNGSWEEPMGKTFEISHHSGHALQFRPILSYSCDDSMAPIMDVGGAFGAMSSAEAFRFAPPRSEYLAVSRGATPLSLPSCGFPRAEDLAQLPPLASDGRYLYHAWMQTDERNLRGTSSSSLVIESYAIMHPGPQLVLREKRYLKRSSASTSFIKSFHQGFSSWRMMTNGYGIFLALVSVTNGGTGHYRSIAIEINGDDQGEFTEQVWSIGAQGLDIPQAIVYDPRLNLVWGWDEKLNVVYEFENMGIGLPLQLAVASGNADNYAGEISTIKICEFVASSLARLAQPFLLEVPLNCSRSRCAVCDHEELVAMNYRDLFLDPFDPLTLRSLSFVAERCTESGSMNALESVVGLILINLHVGFCPRKDPSKPFPRLDSLTISSLKKTLFAASKNERATTLSRLAKRALCEAIPLFWPSHDDKVVLIRQSFKEEVDGSILQRVMRALNEQLIEAQSFMDHRAVLDDVFLNGLFTLIQRGHPLIADAATSMLLGLLSTGFKFIKESVAEDTNVFTSTSKTKVAQSSSSSAVAALFAMTDEEAKEDEGSSQQTGDNSGKSPVAYFDDLISILLLLFDKCIDSKFETCLSSKVLPFALVILDKLVGDFLGGPKTTRSLLRVDSQSFPMRIASLALHVVQVLNSLHADLARSNEFSFTRFEIVPKPIDLRAFSSPGSTGNLVNEERTLMVHVPFACRLSISFDIRSDLSGNRENIRFERHNKNFMEAIGSEQGYSGRNLPGIELPPLTVADDRIVCVYTPPAPTLESAAAFSGEVSEKFAFTVMAQRIVKRKVQQRFYMFHVLEAVKGLLSNVLCATVQSSAYVFAEHEMELMRWIQNAVLSGGLRSVEDSPPRPSLKRGSRASVYSSGDLKVYAQEESEALLNDLLTMKLTSPSLAGSLVSGMRNAINRVPFDQGKLTQPAVCAVAAALIRTNGLETEAHAFAKAMANIGAEQSHVRAPPRLRSLWSAAQLVRGWCDSLVVNGRAKRHLEACGIDWAAAPPESKEEEGDEIDAEDMLYDALCRLVVSRCEFLVRSVYPPPFLRQSRRREDALARWHFIRERYCPRTSRYLQDDPLGAVLRGIRALISIKRPPVSPALKSSPKLGTQPSLSNPSSGSPPIAYTPTQTTRSLRKLVSSDDVLQPMHVRLGKQTENLALTRRASLSSWNSALKRKPSWLGVETIEELSKSNLSSPASSSGGSARFRRGSAASAGGGGIRIKSRAEGGLRRASLDGLTEEIDVVDVARVEHEQSLSESVLAFVQSPTVLRKRDIVNVLKARNERAQARYSGLSIVVAIAQGTDFQSKFGRGMFEYLLMLTMTTIRICGANTTEGDQSVMEAHFMTDLTGCSVFWRERVSAIFLAFIRIVSHQIIRVTKNYRFRPQRKACEHVKLLLDGVILDYVESDYSLLFRSNIIESLQASLALPKSTMVPANAWKVFEILFRRCVIDHVDNNSTVGHIIQQQLMDLLMHGIGSGPLMEDTIDFHIEEDENDEGEDDDMNDEMGGAANEDVVSFTDSPKSLGVTVPKSTNNTITFLDVDVEVRLSHGAARFLSRSFRVSPDFSLFCVVRHRKDFGLTPGKLVCIGGDKQKRWTWLDIEIDAEGRLGIQISFISNQWVRMTSQRILSDDMESTTRLCVTVIGSRWLHVFTTDERARTSWHDSCELENVPEIPLDLPAVNPSPVPLRTRRLSSRSCDNESQLPCLLGGRMYVGSRPGLGNLACQGVTVSDLSLWLDRSIHPQEFFRDATMPVERSQPDAGKASEGPSPQLLYPKRHFAPEHSRVLRSLDLAYAALRKGSSIALARLSTPAAQSTLLHILLDARAPMRVRVTSARVLRRVLKESVPNETLLIHLGKCVSRAMPPSSGDKSELVPDPRASSAMADEVIEMMHFLCSKPGNWAMFLSNWIIQKVGALDRIPLDEKLTAHSDAVRDACAAFAFCGGRFDAIRVGGRAMVVSNTTTPNAFPISLVRIVAQDLVGDVAICDVTENCNLKSSAHSNPVGFSDIESPVPSTLIIESPAPLRSVEMYVENHRLDSPRTVSVRVGARQNKLGTAREMEVPPREGWFTIYSMDEADGNPASDGLSAILKPSDDPEDDFWCAIQLQSVWGYSQLCRVSKIRVTALLSKQDGVKQMDEAQQEDRFICVPSSENEIEDTEDEEEAVPTGGTAQNPAGMARSTEESVDELESEQRYAVYSGSNLVPWTQPPPAALMEGICLATNQDIFEAFHRLLSSMDRRVESSRGAEKRLAMDVQVRVLKVVCAMIGSLSRTHRISKEMASFLLSQAKARNSKLHPVPVAARFRRQGYPDHWKMRFGSALSNEDTVRFESFTFAGWPHRFAIAEVDLTQAGVHSWTFTLMQDASRGDESVLFGICTDKNAMSIYANTKAGDGDDDDLDLLSPLPKFRFLRAFDGSAVGAQPPSPMLCVRIGDSVRCELDLDKGTLSMAVNSRPLVCLFTDIVGPAWPCIGTYSERGTVVVSISNMRCTPSHPRRKCAIECRSFIDIQVEALARQAFQLLSVEGDDASNEMEERSLCFMGTPIDEDGDGEERVLDEGEEAESDGGDPELEPSSYKLDERAKSDKATDLLAQKSPILYKVEDTTVPTTSSAPIIAQITAAQVPLNSVNRPFAQVVSPTNALQAPPVDVYVGRNLTPAGRYEALLWEMLARVSRRAFDVMAASWNSGVSPDDYFVSKGLGEAADSLYRVSNAKDASLDLLRTISEQTLLEYAARGIVGLGNVVLQVKQGLRRPRRKADSAV